MINLTNIKENIELTNATTIDRVVEVPIDTLIPSADNFYEISDIDVLVLSISEMGQIEPLIIKKNNTIISGHRRFEAMKKLGFNTVKAIVKSPESEEEEQLLLMEANRQRKKTPQEFQKEVALLKEILKKKKKSDPEFQGTILEKIAELLGKSLSTVKRADKENKNKESEGVKTTPTPKFNTTIKVNLFADDGEKTAQLLELLNKEFAENFEFKNKELEINIK